MTSPLGTAASSGQPHGYQRNAILSTVAVWAVLLVGLTVVLVGTADRWSERMGDNLQAEQLARRQSDLWQGIEAQWSDHAIDAINQAARIPDVVEALSRKDKRTLNQHLSTRFNGLAQLQRFADWILLDAQAQPFLSLATPNQLFTTPHPVLAKAVAMAAGRAKLINGDDGSLWYVTPIQDQSANLVGWMCIKAEISSLLQHLRRTVGQAALLQLPDGSQLVAVAKDKSIFAANPHPAATVSEAALNGRRYQICGTALGGASRVFIAYDVTDTAAAVRQAHLRSTVTTVALVTALLALGLFILRYRLRPIYSLRDAMLAAHQTGKFDVRVNAKGADEIALLALAFNEMSERINEQFHQLARTNDALKSEITGRKRAHDALEESKRQLEAALHANQLIMDNSRDVICTVGEEGRFITVSAACETLWGYKPEELIGQRYIDMVYPEDRPETNQAAAEIMAGRATNDFENRYIRKDGAVVDMLWSSYWSEADRRMFAVAHDNTERAQIERALKEAKKEADRANHAKSEFLSRMSHELRTPMNAILGFAQLLEMDELTADQQEGVAHIIRGGRHLLELINEVLEISRIEAGRLSLSPEPVEISEALRETIELLQPLAADREVRLSAPPVCDYYLLADRQRLKQVLINLISNSIKYNRPDGSVTLTCEAKERRARIFIKDTGIGIPSERLGQLFTPFERLGAEQSSIEGTGLGLAVAKRLVEAMEGAIGVESVPGEGTTFWLEFPLAESPLIRANLTDETPETRQVLSPEQRSVLHIEDNLSNLRLIERVLLRRPAIKLFAARDGVSGLKMAAEELPDVILLDVNLPDIDGYEVLHRLRTDPRCVAIPVIVVSADATERQKNRLLEAGAANYLTKPLNIKKFLEVLDYSLDGAIRAS